MSVCSEVGISVQVHPRTIVNIVYSVYRHVRVCKVVDVCEVSIQCPYTDVIVFVMYMYMTCYKMYSRTTWIVVVRTLCLLLYYFAISIFAYSFNTSYIATLVFIQLSKFAQ